jgi:predicted phage-related endonuclease
MLTEEQAALHSSHIGGSDAATACGLSPWLSARELYYIFRGEMEREPIDPINAFLGHQLEPMVVQWYIEQTSNPVRHYNRTKHSKRFPWAIAHPDRVLVGYRGGLECKTAATPEGWGAGWDERDATIPDHIQCQVAHYMEVFDYDFWDVAVFFMVSREFRRYRIERDEVLGRDLMNAESTFMEHVEKGEPPAWDYNHPTTLELLKAIYPGTNGKAVDLTQSTLDWWNVMADARQQRRNYDQVVQGAKAHIVATMEEHALGYCPDGTTITQKRTANGALILSKRRFVNFQ